MLGAILVLGAVLRLIDLGDGLWYDEIAMLVKYARRPLGWIVTSFDSQNQHLFYSVLARISVAVFGESAWAIRLPAALFGVASLWAVWWLGVRITSPREALVSAGLLAVSSHHVWFSQDARGYTMLMFFSLVGTALFLRLQEKPASRRLVWAYGIVMALGCWTQVAGGFVLAAHGLVWLWTLVREPRIPPRFGWSSFAGMVLAGVLTFLLYLPVLGSMTRTLAGPRATGGAPEWKSPLWFATEAARGLARGVPGGWISLLAGTAVVVTGLVSFARRSLTVTLLLVMPGVVTAAAMLATAHNLWPRLFFFAAGFAALIAVRGAFAICEALFGARGQLVATVGAVLVGAASAITVPRVWAPKQDYGAARAWVDANRGPGDAVVTVDMARMPYRDYYQPAGWTEADSLPDLLAAVSRAPRTWVLYTFPERLAAVDSATWNHIKGYRDAMRFPGTVQGGAIVVVRSQ